MGNIFLLYVLFPLLVAVGTVGLLQAQMVPDAPVIDFKLPMFGENGYKVWDLQGDEGHYISPEQIDVIGMTLRIFSGDETLRVEAMIESSKAIMLIRESRAESASDIRITGPNYSIEGIDWVWYGSTRTVEVHKNVRVTFREKLDEILQ